MDNPAENHEVLKDLKYAIQHLNYKEMEDILENIVDLNAILNGERKDNKIFAGTNPLIFLIIQHGDKRPIKCLKCVELLIRKNIDLEFKGNDDRTALSWARELRMTDTVNLIESRLKEPPAERELSIPDGLKKYFEEGRENYIKHINHKEKVKLKSDSNTAPPNLITPLQLCCSLNYTISAAYLLDHGASADPKGTAEDKPENKNTPIMLAASRGHVKIIELLLEKGVEVNIEVLCATLKYIDRKDHNFQSSYKKLMDNLKKKNPDDLYRFLNDTDGQSNPPLHYALRYADSAIIEELLRHGASLGSKNNRGKMLIEYISPNVLEKHLNNCIKDKPSMRDKNTLQGEFMLTIDYRSLVPPFEPTKSEKLEPGTKKDERIINETDIIYYMSISDELKHLMKHPVVTNFLLGKWNYWNNLYVIKLVLYLFIVISVTMFVSFETSIWGQILLTIGLILLLTKELFEIIILKQGYFKHSSNFIDLLLIFMLGTVVVLNYTNGYREQLFSITCLLVAFEFMLILGSAPICSTNMVIFSTVLFNFLKFLIWYVVLLLGFALSFYYLLNTNNKSFVNIPESIYKTIIMTSGDIDAGSMDFGTDALIGKIILVAFVFMIPVVLLNLLNGLAVNDIQIIKQNAELTSYVTLAYNIKIVETLMYKCTAMKKLILVTKSNFEKHSDYMLIKKQNRNLIEHDSLFDYLKFWQIRTKIGIQEFKEYVQILEEKEISDIRYNDIKESLTNISITLNEILEANK